MLRQYSKFMYKIKVNISPSFQELLEHKQRFINICTGTTTPFKGKKIIVYLSTDKR